MMRTATQGRQPEQGLTLIEISVILSVLVILAAFLIPSITRFLDEANTIQAKNDVQAIATGLVNFLRDTGQSPSTVFRLTESVEFGAVDILAGPGRMPILSQGQAVRRPRGRNTRGMQRQREFQEHDMEAWRTGVTGSLEDFLQVNGEGIPIKAEGATFGWNGPYITSELGSDPWGNRYLVNVVFLNDEEPSLDEVGTRRNAVFVLSAGPNGILETPFSQPVSNAYIHGDDIAVRVR